MPDDRYARAKAFFQEIADAPEALWDALLSERCGDDADLAARVRSLLEADRAAGDTFLEGHALGPVAEGIAPGTRIGVYRIRDMLGHGGMGAVYLAERDDDQFHKRVALKIIRPGMNTRAILERFRAERQILAGLDHPRIARLLDGGVTPDGIPYFAMEYVDGMPIDVWCDHHRLGLRERLELFRSVCAAVQHAHRNLVVHRDIKPGNILVDASGEPRLLDFGIAKLIDPEDEPGMAGATATHLRLMTPEYASPEQVTGAPITTATDVYSLGVLLFQLLTGRLPYRLNSRAPREIERIICETVPQRPSIAVTGSAGESAAGRRPHGMRPESLRRHLSGDIDTIVLMALRKEPHRRYGSVELFSEDIRRHLEGLPVRARPDTTTYRLGKFVTRHRIPVAAAILVLLSLLMGIVATAWQAGVAAAERDRARLAARKAAQVTDFMIDLFALSNPKENAADSLTAGEILRRGAARIATELDDQPEVRATMANVIGQVYMEMGELDSAAVFVERALSVRRDLYPEGHGDLAASYQTRGNLAAHQGRYDDAEADLRAALAMHRAEFGDIHPRVADNLVDLAGLLLEKGDDTAAEALHRQALTIRERAPDSDPRSIAESANALALALKRQGRYAEAEPLYRRALTLREAAFGPDHYWVANSAHNLAALLQSLGRYDEAEDLYLRSLAIVRKRMGDTHPELATDLNSMAVFYFLQGRYGDAEGHFREALSIWRPALGDSHPHVATGINNLGLTLMNLERFEEAGSLLEEALAIRRRILGTAHPHVANSLGNVARLAHLRGDLAGAERDFRRSLTLYESASGPDHPNVARTAANLAALLLDRGDPAEAEALYERALAIWTERVGDTHPNVAGALSGMGRVRAAQKRPEDAAVLFRRALTIYETALGADHPSAAGVRERLTALDASLSGGTD